MKRAASTSVRWSALVLALASFSAARAQSPAPAGAPPAPPPEVLRWLASAATPIATLEPGRGTQDLAPLGRIVGEARIVAIGEATHGSSEFFAFKERAFEYLVSELGFTDFAMETDWAQALATDAWVERGEGDLQAALKGLAGPWRTEEYRALLEWMRAWNADPAHARKVRIHGLDMQQPSGYVGKRVRAYLMEVDLEVAESVASLVDRLTMLSPGIEDADLDGLVTLFDELHDPFVERSSAAQWALMRQHVVVLGQAYRQRGKRGNDATSWRDRCMADNVRWILRQGGPEARILVSAHNGHVARTGLAEVEGYGTVQSIGRALAEDAAHVKDEDLSLVVIGAAFARGGFYASPAGGGASASFRVEQADPAGIEAELVAAGLTNALIDLASAPADGPVRAWLDTPRTLRGVGGLWDPAWVASGDDRELTTLPAKFDALFFVAEATPARLLEPPR